MAYSLKFAEIIPVCEDNMELISIRYNASMWIIKRRYTVMRLVLALAPYGLGNAIIIAASLEARGYV